MNRCISEPEVQEFKDKCVATAAEGRNLNVLDPVTVAKLDRVAAQFLGFLQGCDAEDKFVLEFLYARPKESIPEYLSRTEDRLFMLSAFDWQRSHGDYWRNLHRKWLRIISTGGAPKEVKAVKVNVKELKSAEIKEFDEFMHEHYMAGAWSVAYRRHDPWMPVTEFLQSNCKERFISGAFSWAGTGHGYSKWKTLDRKWRIVCRINDRNKKQEN